MGRLFLLELDVGDKDFSRAFIPAFSIFILDVLDEDRGALETAAVGLTVDVVHIDLEIGDRDCRGEKDLIFSIRTGLEGIDGCIAGTLIVLAVPTVAEDDLQSLDRLSALIDNTPLGGEICGRAAVHAGVATGRPQTYQRTQKGDEPDPVAIVVTFHFNTVLCLCALYRCNEDGNVA